MVSKGEVIALIKKLGGGGGGSGTTDYSDLSNKPQINGVTLAGDQSGSDLGLLDDVQVNGTSIVSDGVANIVTEPTVTFVETISGTTPSITGDANVRYVCGEVSTISITPPNAGTMVVRFESGTTPAVLTIPATVRFPSGVDLTTLEANTVYEIMITDGVYGGVMTWAVSA